jgi:hypothetical protein
MIGSHGPQAEPHRRIVRIDSFKHLSMALSVSPTAAERTADTSLPSPLVPISSLPFFIAPFQSLLHLVPAHLTDSKLATPFPGLRVSFARSQIAEEESPSGMLVRSGSYVVRSRITDDDEKVWLDFEWGFKVRYSLPSLTSRLGPVLVVFRPCWPLKTPKSGRKKYSLG